MMRTIKCQGCGEDFEHYTRRMSKKLFCDQCLDEKRREYQDRHIAELRKSKAKALR